jgi:hypothetical protein
VTHALQSYTRSAPPPVWDWRSPRSIGPVAGVGHAFARGHVLAVVQALTLQHAPALAHALGRLAGDVGLAGAGGVRLRALDVVQAAGLHVQFPVRVLHVPAGGYGLDEILIPDA